MTLAFRHMEMHLPPLIFPMVDLQEEEATVEGEAVEIRGPRGGRPRKSADPGGEAAEIRGSAGTLQKSVEMRGFPWKSGEIR